MEHRIFVVEDNKEIRELITYLLEKNGYKVESFERAEDFYSTINHILPDLIILDVMLPDGNGIRICEQLKSNHNTKNIPVMLMSANAGMESMQRSGAEDFIAKPFDINNFMNRVTKQIA